MARCVALLGMVATHVLDERTADGGLIVGQALAGGRASALFAVLAGVSIALVTGRAEPFRGMRRARATAGLVARALLIAVILTYYGVLFVLALPFLGLPASWLAVLAGVWVVAVPMLSHELRPGLPERGFPSPSWASWSTTRGGCSPS